MNQTHSRPMLSRRDFLILLAAAGVTAVGGYALYTYTPWLNSDEPANQVRRPFEMSATASAQMRELVRYATLAARATGPVPEVTYRMQPITSTFA